MWPRRQNQGGDGVGRKENQDGGEVGSAHDLVITCVQNLEWIIQGVGLSDFGNKNAGCPLKFGFQTNNK